MISFLLAPEESFVFSGRNIAAIWLPKFVFFFFFSVSQKKTGTLCFFSVLEKSKLLGRHYLGKKISFMLLLNLFLSWIILQNDKLILQKSKFYSNFEEKQSDANRRIMIKFIFMSSCRLKNSSYSFLDVFLGSFFKSTQVKFFSFASWVTNIVQGLSLLSGVQNGLFYRACSTFQYYWKYATQTKMFFLVCVIFSTGLQI